MTNTSHAFECVSSNPLACIHCDRDISWSGHHYTLPGVDVPEVIVAPTTTLRPLTDIDRAAREMERSSPLFRFTDANPIGSLFG